MGVRSFAKDWLVPPAPLRMWKTFRRKMTGTPDLFSGDAGLFVSALSSASVYGEYGCGQSTEYVATHTKLPIIAVDTSDEWAKRVREQLSSRANAIIEWVDVGPLEGWGMPAGYSRRERFTDYTSSIWKHDQKPDLILIDGRFRVACFLTSLLNAASGAVIVFDDYVKRPHYKIIEELVPAKRIGNRQAVFDVPSSFDREAATALLEKFEYVMD